MITVKLKVHRKWNWKRNLNTQCLQFFVYILFVDKQCEHFDDNWKMNKRNRNEAHFVEKFQFTLFTVKRVIEIHLTCHDEKIDWHNRGSKHEIDVFIKSFYLKNYQRFKFFKILPT